MSHDSDDDDLMDLEDLRLMFSSRKKTRSIKYDHTRINWDEHIDRLVSTNKFEQRFRMPLSSFHYLIEELREPLTVSFKHSINSTSGNDPIYPEVIVAVGLQFLGCGDTHSSLADTYGMSDASAYRVVEMFLDAVDYNDSCQEMQVRLPRTADELNDIAQRWRDVSTCPINMLNGHIGAMDGWFPRTEMPFDQVNQADYFSGHYQAYGLNVQAMCDADLLFIYVAVAGPGKINDSRAFSRLRELHKWMEGLPPWCIISADCAYGLSQRLLIPFNAAELLGDDHRTFNFYLSQLRIRIEMAFGLLTTKWRKLRTTLSYSTRKNAQIIRVCTKLHNFVIRMDQAHGEDSGRVGAFSGETVSPLAHGILPLSVNGHVSEFGFLPSSNVDDETTSTLSPQWVDYDSSRRTSCLADVASSGIRRPRYNLDRND